MAEYFCKIEDDTIKKYNVSAKLARKGQINFPLNPTDDDYREIGFWPESGTRPNCDPTLQICTGPSYELDIDTQTINKIYAVTNKPLSEIVRLKLEELAKKAEEVGEQNVIVGEDEISTDQKSRDDINSALSVMGRNPTETTRFKKVGGKRVTATKASLEAIQDVMWAQIKNKNINEEAHEIAIQAIQDDGELTDTEKINKVYSHDINTGW